MDYEIEQTKKLLETVKEINENICPSYVMELYMSKQKKIRKQQLETLNISSLKNLNPNYNYFSLMQERIDKTVDSVLEQVIKDNLGKTWTK